ncbi:NERD domain-containing protein [Clostridium akagii]|uniref:NERD domain-containing protein n=1 Tax=Clostridium akagii TaxID=91623 RepID=UPI000691B16E|nr:NERD domain-containing protein [Clostridium akagii]
MGFLNALKESITNRPSTLREPTFVKEFNEENKQFNDLEKLLKIAPAEVCKKINEDIKLLSYGITGERNVAYELKNSHMPILILHDLYLQHNGLTAQIDFVIIDRKFILVIECKNMVGDIEIRNNGDFIRYFKGNSGKVYKKEGIYSPIVQNERHVEIIRDILKEEKHLVKTDFGMIKHIVTVANPKAVINSRFAKKEIKEHIIKHEQLINRMKEFHETKGNEHWFTEETMYDLANSLLKHNGIYTPNYERKYGISAETKEDNQIPATNENVLEEKVQLIHKEIIGETGLIEESPLYKELKKYRLDKSREEMVKPYFLYSNSVLEVIVKAKPKTIEELKAIKGFGNVKCEKYGKDIIEIVNKNMN